MNRRTVLKSVAVTAVGVSVAGCSDNGGNGGGDSTDTEEDEELFERIEEEVIDEEMAEPLWIPSSTLYRSKEGFGVKGILRNTGDELVADVEVYANLHDPDELIGEFVDDFSEENELNQLPAGRAVKFDILFEDTEPQEVEEAVSVEVWAEGEIE